MHGGVLTSLSKLYALRIDSPNRGPQTPVRAHGFGRRELDRIDLAREAVRSSAEGEMTALHVVRAENVLGASTLVQNMLKFNFGVLGP
jgi:hypothetical protein